MELYDNQFHSHGKNGATKPIVDAKQSKKIRSDASESSDNANSTKRKINHISSTTDNTGISTGEIQKLSKKRAKKLEWKKRQRLKKEARLKSKLETKPVD